MRLVIASFLLLAACSGLEAGITSGAATGDEHLTVTLARDAGPARDGGVPDVAAEAGVIEAPSARACWCETVQVSCSGGGDTYARADRDTCTLHLPPAMCAVLGVAEGDTVGAAALENAALPAGLSADDAFDFCSGRHEATHACDGPAVSDCESEVRAYGVTVSCLDSAVSRLCEGDLAATGDCMRIQLYVSAGSAARELNACLCGGAACGACTEACRAAHPEVDGTCTQAAAAYCP